MKYSKGAVIKFIEHPNWSPAKITEIYNSEEYYIVFGDKSEGRQHYSYIDDHSYHYTKNVARFYGKVLSR